MNTEPRLTRNIAKCNECGDVVESKHRWDFRVCKCGQMSVDGGLAYAKRSFGNAGFTELSEYGE